MIKTRVYSRNIADQVVEILAEISILATVTMDVDERYVVHVSDEDAQQAEEKFPLRKWER
jgi:hypothetical protein